MRNTHRSVQSLALSASALLALAAPAVHAQGSAPSYADAMTTDKPLDKVAGVTSPAAIGVDYAPADRFAKATAYARATDSYSLLIWQGGKLRTEYYFPPHGADLRPESASMAKSVLGLALAAAIADGKIHSIDDPVSRYIPQWQGDPRGDMTVRNIANMASGLTPPSMEGGDQSPSRRFAANGPQAREIALGLPLRDKPGTVFSYANAVSQLLVIVIEKATGEPYAHYVSRRLWKPLGASDAYMWDYEPTGFPRGYSSLLATPRDWLRVGLLIKDHGRANGHQIVPAPLVDAMTAPSAANPNYGWQIWRGATFQPQRFYNDARTGISVTASAPFAVDDILYFDGFGGQRVYISRKLDLVIVRTGEMRRDWDDAMLPNLVIGDLK